MSTIRQNPWLLLVLLLTSAACSNEGKTLNGQVKPGDVSDAVPEEANQIPKKPGTAKDPVLKRDDGSGPSEPKMDESATIPKLVTGTYLHCPVIKDSATSLELGCMLAYKDVKKRVPIGQVYSSRNFVPQAMPGVRTQVLALGPSAAWDSFIRFDFADSNAKRSLKGSVKINFEGRSVSGEMANLEIGIDETAPIVNTSFGIRNVRYQEDNTYLAYTETLDGAMQGEQAIFTFRGVTGLQTNWWIDGAGRIRNPLGICLRVDSSGRQSSYVACEDVSASRFVMAAAHIRWVLDRGETNLCLGVFSLSRSSNDPRIRYEVNVSKCDYQDVNQKWEAFSY